MSACVDEAVLSLLYRAERHGRPLNMVLLSFEDMKRLARRLEVMSKDPHPEWHFEPPRRVQVCGSTRYFEVFYARGLKPGMAFAVDDFGVVADSEPVEVA